MKLWVRRTPPEADLAEEMRIHREMLEEQFAGEGMSRAEARQAAAQRFGSVAAAIEASREQWSPRWFSAVLKDLRFAWRMARRQPLQSMTIVLIVALGVGANTAVMSVLETVLLNPLGLRQADRVMAVRVRLDRLQMRHVQTSAVEYREVQAMNDTFAAATAMEGRYWTTQLGGEATRLRGQAVTPDFFRVFGVYPEIGRSFSADDRESVILSHEVWRTQFGGDASAIGRTLSLDGTPHQVVGVAPAGFRFPANAQVWTPLILSPQRLNRRGYEMSLWVFARLKDGVSAARASDRVSRWVTAVTTSGEGREFARYGYGVELDSLAEYIAGDLKRPLWLLWTAALLTLLTGCANIAGLLLTRAAGRRREIAIRVSLGAARFQIVRQLLIESLLLATLGGIAGLTMAGAAVSFVRELEIPGKPWLALVTLDRPMLIYGFSLALLSGVLFGLVPAVQLFRESQTAALVRNHRRRFQDVFVAAEVAGAFVLALVTVLLLRSLWVLEHIHPGFDSTHLTTAFLLKPANDPGFLDRLRETLRSGAGNQSAALAYPIPFGGGELTSGFNIRYRQRHPGEPEWHGEAYIVSPEYFQTLRIPLLRGRALEASDRAGSALVCLIDARLAERLFPGQDPIGQQINMYQGWARIVGVVGSIRGSTTEEGSRPVVYYSLAQVPLFPQAAIVFRSDMPAGRIIREAVRQTNAAVPIYDMQSMEQRIGSRLGVRRVTASLLTVFGVASLLLAALGLYGVVAQVIAERTHEIGIRMALGARPGQIVTLFVRQGLRAAAIGLAGGLIAAAYVQNWVKAMLYQIQPFDPITFVSVSAGVLVLLLLAVWWPAWRGSRLAPQRALHYE